MKYRTPEYQDIENALMHKRHRESFILPRFTPVDWWECDVCEITKNGYFREFEIKTNARDFRIDKDKSKELYTPGCRIGQKPTVEKKHDLLTAGNFRGPTEFWYVAPRGVLDVSKIPSFAGLIEIEMGAYRAHEIISVRAPKIHRIKANPVIEKTMKETSYWRFHHLLTNSYNRWNNSHSPTNPLSV